MTDKPTPTDAELEALLLDKLPASKHYIRPVIEKMVAAMQAAIDKWGQPVVAGDVDRADAVNLARNALTQYDCAITKKGVRVLAEAVLSMDSALTTPQPTHAQAGAVPLTCEWTHNEDDGFWETACGEAWRFDDGGPGENNMHFCHSCGNSLRIKGGQHGTE